MTKRALLIINPISGTTDKRGLAERVISRLGACGWIVEPYLTTGPGDATVAAADAAAKGYGMVLAAGGDGTINETARGLCRTDVPLAIIPSGSGNGLARHLYIPIDTDMALDVVCGGRTVNADYATVNDRPFFCTCGVGFDAEVSERFAGKGRRGLLTYLQSTLETYMSYNPDVYTIETNGVTLTHEAFLVAVCNASQYGNNAYIAPGASIVDGLLDIIILRSASTATTVKMGVDVMSGTIGRNAHVDIVRAPSLTITRTRGGAAHLDGEPVDNLGDRLDIICHPGQLRIYVPAEIPPFRPLVTPFRAFIRDMGLTFRHMFRP